MCGATTGTYAARCQFCGELLMPTPPQRSWLREHVNLAGILPGATAGTVTYLVYVITAISSSPGFEIAPWEPVIGALLSLTLGALIGSVIAAGVRASRGTHRGPPDNS